MKEYYGIDVSSWNGKPDWSKVTGVNFAILRVTELYGVDKSFEHNYYGCIQNGIKVGVYRYSYAKTSDDSRVEAEDVVKVLNGRHLDFPVFLDLEWNEQAKLSRDTIGEIIEEFRKVIESSGYKFAIYANEYWVNNYLPSYVKDKYQMWLASYPYEKDDNGTIQERLRPSCGIGWQYSAKGKVPGISTNVDMDVFYTDFADTDEKKEEDFKMAVTAKTILDKARSWLGRNEYDGSHKAIIDIYNAHKPLARSYKVKYTDQWCDTCVSALFIDCDAVDLIGGTECGVEEHVKKFKNAGIWIEDGTITPKPGDIIVFNWDTKFQPNDGYSDHIGIVESVNGNKITTIEGNYKDSVARRTLSVGNGQIRGYARPKYSTSAEPVKPIEPEKPTTTVPEVPVTDKKEHAMLQMGSTGDEVRLLQSTLDALGYGLSADGQFGSKTYNAVRSFQSAYGLGADGVVGPKTWEGLKAALAKRKSLIDGLLLKL